MRYANMGTVLVGVYVYLYIRWVYVLP